MTAEELIAEARAAAALAYAPYSHFRVGAVVVDAEGNRYTGANVENSAYGATICAEGSAISHAVSSGGPPPGHGGGVLPGRRVAPTATPAATAAR